MTFFHRILSRFLNGGIIPSTWRGQCIFATFLLLPIIESFHTEFAYIILCLLAMVLLKDLLKKRRWIFDSITILWLVFLGINIFILPFSISIIRSVIELGRYVSFFVIFQWIRQNTEGRDFFGRIITSAFLWCAGILTLLWFLTSIPLFLTFLNTIPTMNLFSTTFGHNRIVLLYLFSIPILSYFMVTKEGFSRNIWLLLFFVNLILFVATYGRGAFIALSIGFAITILLFSKTAMDQKIKNNIHFLSGMTVIMSLVALILLFGSFIFSNFIIPYDQQTTGYTYWKGFYKPVQNENRLLYLGFAWEGFKHSPVVGTGLNTYRYLALKYQSAPDQWSWYAHNHIVELFAETGILGGIAFLLLIGMIFHKIYSSLRNSSGDSFWKFPLVVSILALFIHSFIDYDFHFISIFLFFWIYCALLLPVNIQKMSMQFSQKIFYSVYTLLFFCIFLSLFYSQIDFIFLKARDLKMIRSNIVLALAHTMYIFDSGNAESSTRIGDLYTEMGRESDADIWYQRVIVRQPLYSQRAYIEHCKFLLTNEKLEKIDLLRYCPTLQKSVENIEYYSPESNNHLKSELDQSDPSVAQLLLVSQQIELFSPTTRLFHSYTSFYRFLH